MARSSNQREEEKRRALYSLLDAPSFGGGLLDEPGVVRAYAPPPFLSQPAYGSAVRTQYDQPDGSYIGPVPRMYEALRAANNAPAFVPLPNYSTDRVLIPPRTSYSNAVIASRPAYGAPQPAPAAPAYQAPTYSEPVLLRPAAPSYAEPVLTPAVMPKDYAEPVLTPAVMPVDYVEPAMADARAPVRASGMYTYSGEGGDSSGPDTSGPTGAPGTGNFAEDAVAAAEALGPSMANAAIGAAIGGPMGAAVGMVGGVMGQAIAEALGLSTPATAPATSISGVVGNIAQTQMGVPATSNPLGAIADVLGLVDQPPAEVTTETISEPTEQAQDRSMAEAETQDEAGVATGEASQGDESGEGEGDGEGGGEGDGDGSGDGDGGDGGDGSGDGGGDGGDGGGGDGGSGDGGYRTGGLVRGKKGKAVKATVHGGEYVVRGEAVSKYGRKALDALNDRRVPKGRIVGLLG